MIKKKAADICFMEECKQCKVSPIIETDISEKGSEVVYVHCPLCKNHSGMFKTKRNKEKAKLAAIKDWNKIMKTDG